MMDSCLSLRLSVLTYLILQGQVLHSATFPTAGGNATYNIDAQINGSEPGVSRLILNNDGTTTMNIDDAILQIVNFTTSSSASGAADGGGAVSLDTATLNINTLNNAQVIFQNNSYTSSTLDRISGGVINSNNSVLNIGRNTQFNQNNLNANNNNVSYGAAIHITGNSVLTIGDDVQFADNVSFGSRLSSGGAIYLSNSNITIGKRAVFASNAATSDNSPGVNIGNYGGAIASLNGSITIDSNARFSSNSAGLGGVFFLRSGAILTLNMDDASTTLFFDNQDNSGNNSIAFANDTSALTIDTGASGSSASALLDMRDPMRTSSAATNVTINKNDAGVWALGGSSNFTWAQRTQFLINTGTLYLYAQDEVDNGTNLVATGNLALDGRSSSSRSSFRLATGSSLVAGGVNSITLNNGDIIIEDNTILRGGSAVKSLGGSTPRNELGGSTSLTLTSDNNTQLQGLVNLQALEAGDAFTLNANLVDAPNAVGRVVSSGLGQVTLTGNNTYTGTTTISSGTLALGATGSISPSQGVQVKAGSTLNSSLNADTSIQNLTGDSGAVVDIGSSRLQVNMNSDGRYAGGVNGTGVLAKAGNATLTLTDEAMSFAGEMAIDEGQLTLDIAQDVDYNGTFSGIGTLAKEGLATLSLMGENSTFTGDILVNQGVLNMNGRFTQATAIVAPGTTLKGTGTLNSTTVNGTIAPGNSIGTLTINGNYVQNPGSTYEVEINPQGQSDLINVTGAATINGGTVSVLKEAGTYTPQRYTILTAAGGRTGTYDALVQMMPFLDIGLTYDANNVYLDVARSATIFPDVAQTPNQMSTAAGIESLGMSNPVYDAVLNATSITQAQLAFNTLSGELYSSLLSTFVEESRYARQAVLQHLSDSSMTERMKRLGGRYLWAQGYGSWGEVDSTSNTAEVDRQTQGLFIGADMQAAQHTLGVMAGYSNSKLKAPARLSTAKSDNYTLGLYGRHDGEKLIAKMGAAYTWQQFDVHRQAQLPTFSENLKGSHTAHTAQVFGQLNLVDTFTALHLQPFIGATYVTTDSRRWQEAGIAGLTGHNHFDTFYTHLGVEQGQALIETPTTVIRERVMLAWRHAYTGVYPLSTFAFTSGGNPFAIQGAPIAKDALVMDLGVDAALPQKGLNMRLAYIGQVVSQVQDHGLTGRVSWQFD